MDTTGSDEKGLYSRRSLLKKGAIGAVAVSGAGLLVAACGSTSNASGAPGAGTQSTLDKVLSSKKVRGGFLVGQAPYGAYDANNNVVGFDRDVADLLAKDLGATLDVNVLPDAATRITALVSGKVDFVIASFTMTAVRSESIAFTTPYGPDQVALLGRKSDTNLHTYLDYSGKKVAIAAGTVQEGLAQMNPQINIVRYPDDNTGLQAFRSGQVDAWTGEIGAL